MCKKMIIGVWGMIYNFFKCSYYHNNVEWKITGSFLIMRSFIFGFNKLFFYLGYAIEPAAVFFPSILDNIIAGGLFYLIVQSFREIRQTRNELICIIALYDNMKYNILLQVLMVESDGLDQPKIELIEKLCADSQEAKSYFTEDVYAKILKNFDQDSLQKIILEIDLFQQKVYFLSRELIKNGNHLLSSLYDDLGCLKADFSRKRDNLAFDRREVFVVLNNMNENYYKSFLRFYCLTNSEGEELNRAVMLNLYKDYSW